MKNTEKQVSRTNIIEPMLVTEGGHYFTFVQAICSFAGDNNLAVWTNINSTFSSDNPSVKVYKIFKRRIRRIQLFRLLKKLLATEEKIFIPTAGTTEAYLAGLASNGPIAENKVYLYFHYVKQRRKKIWIYKKVTKKHPNIVAIAPTQAVIEFLKDCGFKNILKIPYPVFKKSDYSDRSSKKFSQLLFAGSVRLDKGFGEVVNLIEYLKSKNENIKFSMQLSRDEELYADDLKPSIRKLLSLDYSGLDTRPYGSSFKDYISLYKNSICLQLYNQADFKDRISGITLDALLSGCPVITLPDTWIADVIKRFDAGEVVNSKEPEQVYLAVKKIIDNYSKYSHRAYDAGNVISEENSAKKLLDVIT